MTTARERSGIAKPGRLVAVVVEGERIVIDVRAMTIKERQIARAELAKIDNYDEVDTQVASIWIALRRTRPDLTFAELCETLTLHDVDTSEVLEDDDSPEASGGGS